MPRRCATSARGHSLTALLWHSSRAVSLPLHSDTPLSPLCILCVRPVHWCRAAVPSLHCSRRPRPPTPLPRPSPSPHCAGHLPRPSPLSPLAPRHVCAIPPPCRCAHVGALGELESGVRTAPLDQRVGKASNHTSHGCSRFPPSLPAPLGRACTRSHAQKIMAPQRLCSALQPARSTLSSSTSAAPPRLPLRFRPPLSIPCTCSPPV